LILFSKPFHTTHDSLQVGVSLPEGAAGVDEVAATISTPAMRGAAALAIAVHLSATYGVDAAAHPPAWMAARKVRELALARRSSRADR
jgi:hypothetical protein